MKKLLLIFSAVLLAFPAFSEATQESALDTLRAQALRGVPKALFDLGYLHDIGYADIPVDSVAATNLYRQAAELGYPPAQNLYGYRLYQGEGAPRDIRLGIEWIEKAAQQGEPRAWNNLGWLFSQGDEEVRDYARALYWFERASEAGVPTAMAQLADLYREGLGTAPDTIKATALYTSAIEKGLRDAEDKLLAMNYPSYRALTAQEALDLGKYYYTHRAPRIGVTLFEIAASQDSPDALALLGDAYSRAVGVPYSHQKSLEYFYRAALAGHPSAQFVIAELLDMYPDALDDLPASYYRYPDPQYWYSRAAEHSVTSAEEATRRLLE